METIQVGHMAKMREALKKCVNYLNVGDVGLCKGECDGLREVMQKALSAPARNCDLYATENEAWDAFCEAHPDAVCPSDYWSEYYQMWLFAKREE